MGTHVQITHFNFTDHWAYSPTPSQQTAINTEMIKIYALYVKDGKHVGLSVCWHIGSYSVNYTDTISPEHFPLYFYFMSHSAILARPSTIHRWLSCSRTRAVQINAFPCQPRETKLSEWIKLQQPIISWSWWMVVRGARFYLVRFFNYPNIGVVGRSWRYCNTRPTRGGVGASSCIPS